MKIRFLVYSSLLFVTLVLPCVYIGINNHLQNQEYSIRKQKEHWLLQMADIECNLFIRSGNDLYKRIYHYRNSLIYISLWCSMEKEDLDNIIKTL